MHTKHLFTFIKHNETIRIGKLIDTEDTYLNIRLSGELLADRLPGVVGDLVQIYRPSLLHVGYSRYIPRYLGLFNQCPAISLGDVFFRKPI